MPETDNIREPQAAASDAREQLTDLIEDHLRRYGAEAARTIETFAALHTMHRTDLQALVLIMNAERQGRPATAKVLRQELGLTSGGVTAVIDRLERLGHVERRPSPEDRRQHTLHYGEQARAVGREFFGPLGARMDAVFDDYSEEQLLLLERFTREVAGAMTAHRQSFAPPPRSE